MSHAEARRKKRKDIQMDTDNKLFPKMEIVVKAIALCCNDDGKSPVARSEVYNETWMLRLALAFIHDNVHENGDNNINASSEKVKDALKRIAKAVKRRWISEGGLKSVFDMEGPTWTDAILGNVQLDKQGDTKRGVVIDNDNDKDMGVVVIEAKMSSALASGITHASDYNQVVRNVACLAQLVMEKDFSADSAFFVFAPRNLIDDWKKGSLGPKYLLGTLEDCKSMIWDVIEKQSINRDKNAGRSKGSDPARGLKYINLDKFEKDFKKAVENIVTNSMVIAWEEIIQSFDCPECEALKHFYEKTCGEYGLKANWQKFANL